MPAIAPNTLYHSKWSALGDVSAACLGSFAGCPAYAETTLEAIVTATLAPLGLYRRCSPR